MPLIRYDNKKFEPASLETIAKAVVICKEYMAEGYTLTLRQLYYQFVARGFIENSIHSYKRLGSLINDARLAGKLDWDAIEDRTRNLEALATWDSPADIVEACSRQFRFDWWSTQPCRVEIWVEKEALAGVIERTAHKFRVPYFACRGYTSQSEAWRAGRRFKVYNEIGQAVHILHLGDHDPSGIDMTRDNDDRLQIFSEGGNVNVNRLALNMKQVRQYNPPPNPAKLTDSRAKDYIEKFGDESWELDALDPKVIDRLISKAIEALIDPDPWAEMQRNEEKARKRIAEAAVELRDEQDNADDEAEED